MRKHHAKTETLVVRKGLSGAVKARKRKMISMTQVHVFQGFFFILPSLPSAIFL
jgi:hypothetical protein